MKRGPSRAGRPALIPMVVAILLAGGGWWMGGTYAELQAARREVLVSRDLLEDRTRLQEKGVPVPARKAATVRGSMDQARARHHRAVESYRELRQGRLGSWIAALGGFGPLPASPVLGEVPTGATAQGVRRSGGPK